jgi:hypothetical protein
MNPTVNTFYFSCDLLRTIGLTITEDMIHPKQMWLICRIGVPEPAEKYFLQGFPRWHVEWIEVVGAEGIVLSADPVLMPLQTIVSLTEEVRDRAENSGRVRLVAQPGAVSLDRVAQQYARATTDIATDQLWAALRQWGAATLPRRKGCNIRWIGQQSSKMRGRGLLCRVFLLLLIVAAVLRQRVDTQPRLAQHQNSASPLPRAHKSRA